MERRKTCTYETSWLGLDWQKTITNTSYVDCIQFAVVA